MNLDAQTRVVNLTDWGFLSDNVCVLAKPRRISASSYRRHLIQVLPSSYARTVRSIHFNCSARSIPPRLHFHGFTANHAAGSFWTPRGRHTVSVTFYAIVNREALMPTNVNFHKHEAPFDVTLTGTNKTVDDQQSPKLKPLTQTSTSKASHETKEATDITHADAEEGISAQQLLLSQMYLEYLSTLSRKRSLSPQSHMPSPRRQRMEHQHGSEQSSPDLNENDGSDAEYTPLAHDQNLLAIKAAKANMEHHDRKEFRDLFERAQDFLRNTGSCNIAGSNASFALRDPATLIPLTWLNDEIVYASMCYLAAAIEGLHVVMPSRSRRLFQSFCGLDESLRAIKQTKAITRFQESLWTEWQIFIIPVSDDAHWFSICVTRGRSSPDVVAVEILDSLVQHAPEKLERLQKHLIPVLERLQGVKRAYMTNQLVQKQTNGSDCGIHAVFNAVFAAEHRYGMEGPQGTRNDLIRMLGDSRGKVTGNRCRVYLMTKLVEAVEECKA